MNVAGRSFRLTMRNTAYFLCDKVEEEIGDASSKSFLVLRLRNKTASQHPRGLARHARAEGRAAQLAVAHRAGPALDTTQMVRALALQPIAQHSRHGQRQVKHLLLRRRGSGFFRRCQGRGDLAIFQTGNDRRDQHSHGDTGSRIHGLAGRNISEGRAAVTDEPLLLLRASTRAAPFSAMATCSRRSLAVDQICFQKSGRDSSATPSIKVKEASDFREPHHARRLAAAHSDSSATNAELVFFRKNARIPVTALVTCGERPALSVSPHGKLRSPPPASPC